jgi:hypothetical protein
VDASHLAAISDEGWSELIALEPNLKRKHMHWCHVRTYDLQHRQPDSFTPQELWKHILKVYKVHHFSRKFFGNAINLIGLIIAKLSANMRDRKQIQKFFLQSHQKLAHAGAANCAKQLGQKL